MFDFLTAVHTDFTAITFFVIAALVIIIVAQAYVDARRLRNRLRAQAKRLGNMTGDLLAAATMAHKLDTERQVGAAIEFTYDMLKGIGFDKLASDEVTLADVMLGDARLKAALSRRRPSRDNPFEPFSLDELRKAFGSKPRHNGTKPVTEPHSGDTKMTGTEEGNGGQKGPRLYRRGADIGLDGRSPRAG